MAEAKARWKMFNQCDYRMAKAQQERLLAQAQREGNRARRPNPFLALIRRLVGRSERVQAEPRAKRATA